MLLQLNLAVLPVFLPPWYTILRRMYSKCRFKMSLMKCAVQQLIEDYQMGKLKAEKSNPKKQS